MLPVFWADMRDAGVCVEHDWLAIVCFYDEESEGAKKDDWVWRLQRPHQRNKNKKKTHMTKKEKNKKTPKQDLKRNKRKNDLHQFLSI